MVDEKRKIGRGGRLFSNAQEFPQPAEELGGDGSGEVQVAIPS